jgi:hypothetical protein
VHGLGEVLRPRVEPVDVNVELDDLSEWELEERHRLLLMGLPVTLADAWCASTKPGKDAGSARASQPGRD